MNRFAIECNDRFIENVCLTDSNGNPIFTDFVNMTYDEMKSSEDLENFVDANMDAAICMFGNNIDQVAVTLIDENDIFIWSIMMGIVDNQLRYVLVDWKKDGKNYRYAS